ncbi:MAG: polysaccharide deacetylase family protein [Gammaproteobacteria bacterium]|nr:polysaccharide deacetylase family protein [Gammaproteobacteria bacterium]
MARITLSFDNGPEPSVTPHVLECLAKHEIAATFFVLGRKVSLPEGRALSEAAVAAGHRVGNHTWNHRTPLGLLDSASAMAEFEDTANALSWLSQTPPLFRPFGGAGSFGHHLLHPSVVEQLVARQYTCVLWNCVPGDFRDPDGWMERALHDVKTREWNMLVLHDLPNGAMRHLDRFLHTLRDDGHEFAQEYPDECIPIKDGRILMPLEPLLPAAD